MEAKVNALQVLAGIAQPNQAVLAVIGECRRKLAMDFDTPAQQIILFHAAKLGLNAKQFNSLCEKISGTEI